MLQYVCSATSVRQCMFCYMGTVRKLCGRTVFDYTAPQKHTGHLHALQPFLLMLPNADWAVSFLNFHSIQGSFLLIWQRRKLPCSFTPCSYSIKEAAPFFIQLFLWDFDSINPPDGKTGKKAALFSFINILHSQNESGSGLDTPAPNHRLSKAFWRNLVSQWNDLNRHGNGA